MKDVNLHPIDLPIDNLKSEMSVTSFDPSLLESKHLRSTLVPGF